MLKDGNVKNIYELSALRFSWFRWTFWSDKKKGKGEGNRKNKMRRFTRASRSEPTARDVVDEDLYKARFRFILPDLKSSRP